MNNNNNKTTEAMIDKKELLDGDGMVRWEHEISQGLPTEHGKKEYNYD